VIILKSTAIKFLVKLIKSCLTQMLITFKQFVITSSASLIRKCFICLTKFRKTLLCMLISHCVSGMQLHTQPPKGILNLLLSGIPFHAKQFVKVLLIVRVVLIEELPFFRF
jgi:hypothetical protein